MNRTRHLQRFVVYFACLGFIVSCKSTNSSSTKDAPTEIQIEKSWATDLRDDLFIVRDKNTALETSRGNIGEAFDNAELEQAMIAHMNEIRTLSSDLRIILDRMTEKLNNPVAVGTEDRAKVPVQEFQTEIANIKKLSDPTNGELEKLRSLAELYSLRVASRQQPVKDLKTNIIAKIQLINTSLTSIIAKVQVWIDNAVPAALPPSVNGDLRLARGKVLQVFHDNQWRGICKDSFNEVAGGVACKQMGGTYSGWRQTTLSCVSYWLDDVGCRGNEDRLEKCSHGNWGAHNCGTNEYISIECTGVAETKADPCVPSQGSDGNPIPPPTTTPNPQPQPQPQLLCSSGSSAAICRDRPVDSRSCPDVGGQPSYCRASGSEGGRTICICNK